MAYISAIAVDFGSTNSGCARITTFDQNGNLKYDTPHLIHSTGVYAKDNTWFYIEPSFLERIIANYDNITDEDFRIESRVLHSDNPNIIWGREPIRQYADKLISENWVQFKNFKMLLRDGVNDAVLDFPLLTIIKTFLRVLKIECLYIESNRMERPVISDEILWGVTIPAIWDDENKRIMRECVYSVFSDKARILSEPEGPLVSHFLMAGARADVNFVDGRTSLVIDMGGGTTDICLMKEVKQPDGNFKLEMVANSDGSAAGGNDIDRNFYLYMLRFISKGKVSDAGVAYDTLGDDALYRTAFEGFTADIKNFCAFENNWLSLKSQMDLGRGETCSFNFSREYRLWLDNNGHRELAATVKEMLIDGCEFPTEQFLDKVLNPTIKKVCDKVQEIIAENKDRVSFDAIIFAGGMSQNYYFTLKLKQAIRDILGDVGDTIKEAPGLFAGSAVMTGTCFLLVNKSFIERIALRNYYYDCCLDIISRRLCEDYNQLGIALTRGEINTKMDDENEAGFKDSAVLRPIVVKGKIIKPYHRRLATDKNQTHVNVDFFSTDGEIVIYANGKNPSLKKEGEIDKDCKENSEFDFEVDFNAAVISNGLYYILKEAETGKIVAEGDLKDVFEK